MKIQTNKWSRSRVAIGLAVHFAVWWVFLTWLWMRGWKMHGGGAFPLSLVWQIVTAPVSVGMFYLTPRTFWSWGVAGILVSIALLCTVVAAVTKRRRWLVLLAH